MPRISLSGVNINYETFGEGEPLLLIMGFTMPGAAWAPMLPFLSGFKCICFDNRGTGHSDKPDGVYTIDEMADDASNLLRAIGVERAKVYGISMGGMIAQELALRHPEQISKAVLGCTMPGGPNAILAADEILQTLIAGSRIMARDPEFGLDMVLPLLYPPEFLSAHPEIKHLMLAGMRLAPPTPPETADRLIPGLMQFDAYDRLDEIRCPVLIVHGAKDVLIPPGNATLLKDRIPNAEIFMVPDAGHNYPVADMLGIHQRITAWLRN